MSAAPPAPRPRSERRTLIAPVAAATLLLSVVAVACGDSETVNTGGSTPSTETESAMSKPTVSVPSGPAPTSLVTEDLVVGDGAEAVAGKQVTVQYVGVHYSDGSQFDASWDRGEPFSFLLGGRQVIAGWDQGVVGMKAGGRRQLTIPGDLAYGAQGFPPVIQPNETLVFVVDLLAVG